MYLVMNKGDYDAIEGLKDISNIHSVYVGLYSDKKKARAYCKEVISDELADDMEPSTFVILEINEFYSSVITGKLDVVLSSKDLK